MKLFKLIVEASLLVFLTTGCSISSESPEELIKEKPIYNEGKYELYNEIKQLLPKSSTLILPSNSTEVGKINEVDLNNDGVDELVVFEKKENLKEQKTEVGFIILKKDKHDSYTYKNDLLQSGNSIEYANFYDLNNDGQKEIVLLIKEGNKTNMHVYSFEDDEIKLRYTLNPKWIKDNENLLDLKVQIGHVDNDKILDILIIHYDSKNSKAYASLVNFDSNLDLNWIDFTQFDNVRQLSNLYVSIDTIAREKVKGKIVETKGFILNIPIVQDNNYITQILYIKDKKINKAFDDNDRSIMKPYYIPTEDINNDKIIEIPRLSGSGNIYTQKNSANISWYKWNGKEDEKSGLVFVSQIYYNYQYNYKMFIPNNLANSIIIEQEYKGNNDVLFKFYYYNQKDAKRKSLFTIAIINKNIIEDKKNTPITSGNILGETDEYSFVLYQNDVAELEKLKINIDTLKEYFSLIY